MQRLLMLLLILLMAGWAVLPAHAQENPPDDGTAIITEPTEGEQLFGLVVITGTATHPTLYAGYTLDWSPRQNPDEWQPIQPLLNAQVENGVLGQWDTVAQAIPDGIYQIRLRMYLNDGTYRDAIVPNLQVVNSQPTPLPTAATGNILPTPNPVATSPIEQPPTRTPVPTFEQPVPVAISSGDDAGTLFDASAVTNAFCSGVYFTAALFAVVVAYLLVRRQISPYTRRLWWQIRSEFEDDGE